MGFAGASSSGSASWEQLLGGERLQRAAKSPAACHLFQFEKRSQQLVRLHDGIFNSDGALIGQNDNWRDSQAAEITQASLGPLDRLESAIILNLAPGNYTAVVSGVGGGT